ncbi:MAG: isocitrate lyase/PEP mutase family protein [SAR324 cluster bacterium]|nr:isocitrate lyase/PEP mutase family protein [SAR324 cluster bacterium]
MDSLRKALSGDTPVRAPLVLNPLMAKMAEAAGFPALYLGGGATGYAKVALEANLNLTEMVQAGADIRAVTALPLILDAAAGWGDPMHMVRTIGMAEGAGFAAIEIEDQLLPKRAHHHIGIEHMVPQELMEAKVREAVGARRDPDFLIIGRSNGVRASNMDDALRRAEGYRKAGADLLLLSPRNPEEARRIGERLGPPLMHICRPGGLAAMGLTLAEMHALGIRIIVDPVTPLLAAYEAMGAIYQELAGGFAVTARSPEDWEDLQERMHSTIGLEALLAIEKETVERD